MGAWGAWLPREPPLGGPAALPSIVGIDWPHSICVMEQTAMIGGGRWRAERGEARGVRRAAHRDAAVQEQSSAAAQQPRTRCASFARGRLDRAVDALLLFRVSHGSSCCCCCGASEALSNFGEHQAVDGVVRPHRADRGAMGCASSSSARVAATTLESYSPAGTPRSPTRDNAGDATTGYAFSRPRLLSPPSTP